MLADVQPAWPRHSRDCGEHRRDIRHIACAHRVDHQIELARGEHRQLVHRRLHDSNVEAALGGDGAVEGEHLAADVDDRHAGAGRCVECAVATAARRQTQNTPTADVAAEPAGRIDRGEWILELLIARRRGERYAFAGERVPSFGVLGNDRPIRWLAQNRKSPRDGSEN